MAAPANGDLFFTEMFLSRFRHLCVVGCGRKQFVRLAGSLAHFISPALGDDASGTLRKMPGVKLGPFDWPTLRDLLGFSTSFWMFRCWKMPANFFDAVKCRFDAEFNGVVSACFCIAASMFCALRAASSTGVVVGVVARFGNIAAVPLIRMPPVSGMKNWKQWWWSMAGPMCQPSLPCGAQLSCESGSSQTSACAPGGARGDLLKSNSPNKSAWAERCGFVLDARNELRASAACSSNSCHCEM